MDALLPQFEKQLQPGAKLYSVDFKFSNKQPVEVIQLDRPPHTLGQKVYIYQF